MAMNLINDDCLKAMKSMQDGSFEAVVSDPPYGTRVAAWDSDIPPQEILQECLRVSSGAVVWFGASLSRLQHKTFQYVPMPDRVLIWYVPFSMNKTSSNGMFYKYHPIYCWRLPKDTGLIQDVLVQSTEAKQHGFYHPGMKPIKLMRRIVAGLGAKSILDPFMGSGTTGIACAELGVDFTGIEIDSEYFRLSEKRIKAVQPSFWNTPPNTACTGRLDSSANQMSFAAEGNPPAKARGAKRRQ